MSQITPQALNAKAWPFEEAKKILNRIKNQTPKKNYVLFETGYGPSGLPHIGTFGEVARTTMVRNAFSYLAPDIKTRLFCVSDDMDGFRKVPENLPHKEMLEQHLGKPLTAVPDPFGTHESYGAHMNARLVNFLDRFGFEYEFKSSTENYKSGIYDEKLLQVLANYDKIMKVMLPTLGADRQKTYSPFMPLSPKTGRVLQVPILGIDVQKGIIEFNDEDGEKIQLPVTEGNCKLQWKPDLGMRWAALDVDFEMYGKDHLASAKLYSDICRIIGGTPPEQFMYELFLDENGEKISKSKGNGLTMEEWLRYAPTESLSYYMFCNPRKAKKLYFDVIPKAVDEYLTFLDKYQTQAIEEQIESPIFHIHNGVAPKPECPISFALLLNLASACHAEEPGILWGFISRYAPNATPDNSHHLNDLVEHALCFYQDFIKPLKTYRAPSLKESAALTDLANKLRNMDNTTANDYQNEVYNIGKTHNFENLRDWFGALYETLLGQSQGPRFGSFIELYGRLETANLIDKLLKEGSLS